jgi:hypothetical protein
MVRASRGTIPALKGKNYLKPTPEKGYYLLARPEECFPHNWLESLALVIFDFRGIAPTDPPDETRDTLWCLVPDRAAGNAVVVAMSREDFVAVSPSRPTLLDTRQIISDFTWHIQNQRQPTRTPPVAGARRGRF